MLDVVLYSVLIAVSIFLYAKYREYNKAIEVTFKTWDSTIRNFMKDNNISDMDLEIARYDYEPKLKKKFSGSTKIIAKGIDKGYDLLSGFYKKGSSFPPYSHTESSELFYVISGKLKVSECLRSPTTCDECAGKCALASNFYKDNIIPIHGDVKEHFVSSGNYFYGESGRVHSIEVVEDSHVLVISLPPFIKGLENVENM